MSKEKRTTIARNGGLATQRSGKAHVFTHEEASAAGKIGGKHSGIVRAKLVGFNSPFPLTPPPSSDLTNE